MRIVLIFISLLFITVTAYPQATVLISAGGTVAVNNGDNFYDAGGAAGNDNNTNYTITLSPALTGEKVCLDFTMFKTYLDAFGGDVVDIFDGSTTAAPNIGSLMGDYTQKYNTGISPFGVAVGPTGTRPAFLTPSIFSSTNPAGTLTIRFTNSDASTNPGFAAKVITYKPIGVPGCNISLTGNTNSVCSGATVNLTATGNFVTAAVNSNFNSSSVDSGWSPSSAVTFTSNVCASPSPDGSVYLWMANAGAPRRLTTVAMNVINGGILSFDFRQATNNGVASPCESPDINSAGGGTPEGIYVEYSTDGGTTWTTFKYIYPYDMASSNYNGCGNYVTAWRNMVVPIPAAAQTSSTMFRWNQEIVTGPTYDNWGLDNVVIASSKPSTITITNVTAGGTLVGSSATSPFSIAVNPTVTTTYRATITDGVSSCFSDFTVTIANPAATISYPSSPYSTTISTPQPITFSGTTGGVFSASPAGLIINASTGAITPQGSTTGPYTVTYTIAAAGACPIFTTTTTLNIITTGCTTCSNPGCTVSSIVATTASLGQTGISTQLNADGNQYNQTVTPGNSVTICVPVTVPPLSTILGFKQLSQASPGGCSDPTEEVVTYQLKPANDCAGAVIPPNRTNAAGVASGFNPEWDNIPAGNYVLCYTMNVTSFALCSTVSIFGLGYYNVVPPTVCQDYQIQMYSDLALTTPIVKSTFSCSDSKVYLSPATFPVSTDFNSGLPYNAVRIKVTVLTGNGNNLVINRYNSANQLVETLPYAVGVDNLNYFLRPTGQYYAFDKTNGQSGTYAYTISDIISGVTLASGVWTIVAGAESAKSILIIPSGTAAYSGAGVTNGLLPNPPTEDFTDDRGLGYFDPATAGAGPHIITYSWNNGLPPPNNCTLIRTMSVTVNPIAPPVGSVTIQPTCSVPTGTIVITSPVGATYQYSIDGVNYQAGTSFSGLAPNANYNVTVKHLSSGCTSAGNGLVLTVNAVPGAPIAPSVIPTQPTCAVATGSITITGVGGETYSFDGSAYAATLVYGGLAAGSSHTITAKNASGCISAVTNITLNAQPATPGAPSVTPTQPTCALATGSVTITGVGGETYSFDGSAYAATLVYGGLAAGSSHTITAKNASGCISAVTNITLNAQPATPVAPSVTPTQPTCAVATGSVTITGVGGETYSFDGSAYTATLVYGGLAAGSSHTITSKNAAGCISAVTNITLNAQPATPVAPSVTPTQPTCAVATGSITITGVGGETYSFDGTAYAATLVYGGLAAGSSHTITAKNAAGCISAVTNITLNAQPATPVAPSVTPTQPTCAVATGSITITGVGGETYSFDGSAYAATLVYGGLAAGSSHTITAKNAAGCISAVTNITLNAQPATPVAPSATPAQPTCSVATGSITITGVGGETYSFDGTAYAATLVYGGLAAGSSHTITAKNAAGCISAVTNITLNAQPATPGAPSVTPTQPTCSVATGSITITGVGGETYSFDGTAYAATLVYGGLAAGSSHTITTKNAAGCISAVTNITLNAQPATPVAPSATPTQPTCSVATGSITITGVGGETYSFDGSAYAATLVYGGLAAGSSHTITAKNAAGCISAVTNITLNAQPATPVAPSATPTQPTCSVATGSITITGVGGETYSFDGSAYAATLVYGGLAAGSSHTITAKNAAGCISAVTNITLNAQPAPPGAPSVTPTQPTCAVATGSITITGVGGETYSFDGSAYAATLVYGGLAAGSSHTITAKNASGCISAVTNITLNAQPATPGAPSVTPTQPTCTVATGSITITGVGGETYSFDGSAYAATLVYGGLTAGSSHTITAKNAAGCISAVTNITLNAQPAPPGAPSVTPTQPTCAVATGSITITGVAGETYSFDGSPYAATLVYSGLAAGSSHSITAKNAAGCISTVTNITLNAQPAIPGAPSVTPTQPTCAVATGSITITGVAGETYSFDGTAYAATLVYSGLAAGSSHTITARNAAGCISAVTNITLNAQPATPGAPSVTPTQPTCAVATGSITITGVGGETYSFDGSAYAATLVYGGLAAGSSHTITAKNAAGCISAVTNITLNAQPATPGAPSVTPTQPTCAVATGSITITGVGGETYSFDGSAYAATLVYGGLAAGSSHTITAKNAAGCISAVTNITLNVQPATPSAPVATPIQPTCTVATGSITIIGVAGEAYSFDGSAYAATLVYGGLAAGSSHTITAKNSAGCISAVTNITLNAQPASPTAPGATPTQPTCTVATGSITIIGVAGETYSFDGSTYAATLVYGGLAAGSSHTITAKNAAGCISAVTNITLNAQPATPGAPSVTPTQPTCAVATGSITITGVGGETYSFDGSAYAATLVYSGLAAGSSHTITAKNAAGCISAVTNITLNAQPATPVAPSATPTQPTCSVATGSITITGVGGETYSFDGSAYAATLVYGGLAAGSSHTITAKNAAGCISAVTNITLSAQPATPASPVVTATQPTCTVATGSITITGVAGETYSFDGSAYAATLVYGGLAAASTHTITAKNAAGCISAVTNITLNAQPITPSAPVVTINQPGCNTVNGSFTVTAPIGGNLEYSINAINYQSSTLFSNLAPNNYSLTVHNTISGCYSIALSVVINQPPVKPVPEFTVPTNLCAPNASASFTNNTSISDGSIGLVNYIWNFGDNTGSIASPPNSPAHVYTNGGTYIVSLIATSNRGCTDSIKKTIIIANPPVASFSILTPNQLCSNAPVTLLNLSTSVGNTITKAELYWDYPDLTNVTVDNNPVPNKSYSHQYTEFGTPATLNKTVLLRVYNANGCMKDSSLIIQLKAVPKISLRPLSPVCENAGTVDVSGATDLYNLGGNGVFVSGPGVNGNTFDPTITGNGTFTLEYRDTALNGCYTSSAQNIIVDAAPVVEYPSAFITEPGFNITLNPTYVSGNVSSYSWTELPGSNFPLANYLNNTSAPAPTVLNPTHDVNYRVYFISTPGGCIDSATVAVKVLEDFVVPNTFTPNNDGVNDYWEIEKLVNYPSHRVQIFNRYGQLLHETNRYVHWDGMYKGKALPFGTYYYIIELGGKRKAKTGYVTIIR